MKVKEIEFGVTVNLGNYESSKLSIRVEVEEWEDYHQTLTELKKEVIELAGGFEQEQANLLRRVGRRTGNQELKEKAKQVREFGKLILSKEDELEDLTYKLSQVEDRVIWSKDLLKSIQQFENCSLTEAQKLIKTYEELKAIQNPSEDPDGDENYF